MPLSRPSLKYNADPTNHGLLAWNFDGPSATNGSSAPLATAGVLYLERMSVPVASLVTGIAYDLATLGASLTSGQCFAALFSASTGALIGVTGDLSAVWAAPGTTGAKLSPLAGGPINIPAGDYYVGFWFNGTTGPAFYRTDGTTGLPNFNIPATSSRWGTSNSGLTTTPPSTLGTISAANVAYWAALY